jgi:GxxExxY protein
MSTISIQDQIAEQYKDLTYKVIGAAMEVHKHLGCGFQEVVYQRSLKYEFELQGIPFLREEPKKLYYKGVKVGERRVDFLVADDLMVELKAVSKLDDVHLAQALNYLDAYQLPIGLLINFGSQKLEYKRVIHPSKNHFTPGST